MNDQKILAQIRENHYNSAIRDLYSYYPVIRKMVLANHGTRTEAEDLFQEALVILCRKVRSADFELSSSLNTYLYSVCKLLWLEELRKKQKNVLHQSLQIEDTCEPLAEQAIDEERPLKKAQQAIARLGAKCKELLELFYFQKKSMKEIAVLFGFSTERVAKNQKYRCIEKAKSYLESTTL